MLGSKTFTSLKVNKKRTKGTQSHLPSEGDLIQRPETFSNIYSSTITQTYEKNTRKRVADLSSSPIHVPTITPKKRKQIYVAQTSAHSDDEYSSQDKNKKRKSNSDDDGTKDGLLDSFDINKIKLDTDKLLNKMKKTKAKSTQINSTSPSASSSKYLDKLFLEAVNDKVDENSVKVIAGTSLNRCIYDDSEKINEVATKYERKKFTPIALRKDELLEKRVEPKLQIAKQILNGEIGSYFYELARDFSNSSHRLRITDMEIINLPKDKYHGYMGTIRAHLISQYVIEKLDKLLQEKNKFNKVVQFWGINYFTRYVLTSEIIARVVAEDYKFGKDLDKAYDLMETTNDYGLYIMDKVDPYPVDNSIRLDSDDDDGDDDGDDGDDDGDDSILVKKVERKRNDKPKKGYSAEKNTPIATIDLGDWEVDNKEKPKNVTGAKRNVFNDPSSSSSSSSSSSEEEDILDRIFKK